MSEKETEFKYLLTCDGLEQLGQLLGKPIGQRELVNRYFEPRTPTARRDWVLRLRLLADGNVLTLKMGKEIEPGLFDSVEYSASNVSVNPEGWEDLEPLKVFRKEISQEPLGVQGESKTCRRVFEAPVEAGEYWELDLCTLPNGEQFCELEIELTANQSTGPSRELVETWLAEKGLDFEVSRQTKYARFLAAVSGGS